MAQIRSASSELVAFFETGDVPTADQFTDFIYSTAVYDGTLPIISSSAAGTGSFAHLIARVDVGSNLIPSNDNTYDLGSTTFEWKNIYIDGTTFTDQLANYTASNAEDTTINLSSSLIPATTNIFDLGSSTKQFKNVYIDGISFIDHISGSGTAGDAHLTSSMHIVPGVNNIYTLGNTELKWKDLHVDGNAFLDTVRNTAIPSVTGSMIVSGNLTPGKDDTYDLGASGAEWKDLYVDGTAYIDTLSLTSLATDIDISSISCSAQLLNVSGTIHPGTDDTYDLGTSGLQWKDLYIDGTANIDTLGSAADATTNAYITTATVDVLASSGSLNANITVSGSLIPGKDNTIDLGSVSKEYKNIHIDGIASIDVLADISASDQTVFVSSSLIPTNDDIWSLGSATNQWKDLHIDGTANIDTLNADSLDVSGVASINTLADISASAQTVFVSSSLVPTNDDVWDLGSSTNEWNDLHIDGTANIDTLAADSASFGRFTSHLIPSNNNGLSFGSVDFKLKESFIVTGSFDLISSSLVPYADDTYDLGSSDNKWKDLYVDGTANIDSGSIDVLSINATVSSSLVPNATNIYNLGSSTNNWKDLHVSGTANIDTAVFNTFSNFSASFDYSSSYQAVRLQSLPTTEELARNIGTGSLYLSNISGSDSMYLTVFTG